MWRAQEPQKTLLQQASEKDWRGVEETRKTNRKKEKTAEKPHKTILTRPQKRPHPKEVESAKPPLILKEKSITLPNAKEKLEALIGNDDPHHDPEEKGGGEAKKDQESYKNQQEQEPQVEPGELGLGRSFWRGWVRITSRL